jgi:hypothetical protein
MNNPYMSKEDFELYRYLNFYDLFDELFLNYFDYNILKKQEFVINNTGRNFLEYLDFIEERIQKIFNTPIIDNKISCDAEKLHISIKKYFIYLKEDIISIINYLSFIGFPNGMEKYLPYLNKEVIKCLNLIKIENEHYRNPIFKYQFEVTPKLMIKLKNIINKNPNKRYFFINHLFLNKIDNDNKDGMSITNENVHLDANKNISNIERDCYFDIDDDIIKIGEPHFSDTMIIRIFNITRTQQKSMSEHEKYRKLNTVRFLMILYSKFYNWNLNFNLETQIEVTNEKEVIFNEINPFNSISNTEIQNSNILNIVKGHNLILLCYPIFYNQIKLNPLKDFNFSRQLAILKSIFKSDIYDFNLETIYSHFYRKFLKHNYYIVSHSTEYIKKLFEYYLLNSIDILNNFLQLLYKEKEKLLDEKKNHEQSLSKKYNIKLNDKNFSVIELVELIQALFAIGAFSDGTEQKEVIAAFEDLFNIGIVKNYYSNSNKLTNRYTKAKFLLKLTDAYNNWYDDKNK